MHSRGALNNVQEGHTSFRMSSGGIPQTLAPGATVADPMVIEGDDQPQQRHQDTTFGLLSDDDLMSSFTVFTAKLSDSLLARDNNVVVEERRPLQHGHYNTFGGAIVHNQQDNTNRTATAGGVVQPLVQEPQLEMMMVDTALPTLSPTASSESQSPSPWIPWHSGTSAHDRQQRDLVANSSQGGIVAVHPFAQANQPTAGVLLPPQPLPGAPQVPISSLVMSQQTQQQHQHQQQYQTMIAKDTRDQALHHPFHHPSAAAAFGLDVQSVQVHPQGGYAVSVNSRTQGVEGGTGSSFIGEKQVEAWNQYLQYLLHQQEMAYNQGSPLIPQQQHLQQQQHVQLKVPFGPHHQQPQQVGTELQYVGNDGPPSRPTNPGAPSQGMDPHWQATMMTMMIDQNPTSEAIQGFGQQLGFYITSSGVGGGESGNGGGR
ncbi:hypothetical protein EC991_003321 [Linnemannia zychae]|nr:hypothetical protein EC991_003321 [Linnemannia zychae]